jgi:hypothetical protein
MIACIPSFVALQLVPYSLSVLPLQTNDSMDSEAVNIKSCFLGFFPPSVCLLRCLICSQNSIRYSLIVSQKQHTID